MLRMKYIVTLTLVAVLMASGAAFAGPFTQLEYVTPLAPTSVPQATAYTAPTFGDVDGDYWAFGEIEECAATHTEASDFIVQGYGSGTYETSLVVTRGSMAVFIARAAGYTSDVSAVSFQDVPDTFWAYTEIEQCVTAGVVQGYADYFGDGIDAYLPGVMVDRGQMAVYIYRAAGLSTVAYQTLFEDVAEDYWAALEIEACADANIVQGYGVGIGYLPGNLVTRAQMAVFVWRGLVRGDGDVVLGGPAVTDDAAFAPTGGDDSGELFYPDDIAGATGANTTDLVAEPGAVVFVVLDAAQIGDGNIVFEVSHDDGGDPPVVTVDGGATLGVTAAAGETAVNTATGEPYLVAAYQIDSGLAAEDYTLTITLPNGNVQTMTFTVE